ncbi:hypothetical protein COLO4_06907 [Corchorus olitorius]|uniref:Uncharacterized protein n=1 Tax=Corchorus olitorius TaxID=93759 RepID=A0A1R3KLJ7_9ROSI|nr:hypothetical protein COLO4_06907 [Corchorus olitorius]
MWALKASSTSLLFNKLMASFKPWATRDEKRKKLKETTSKTKSFFATSMSASQGARFSRLCWPGVVKERPTKTAMVKRELTLTRPSKAVTWTLVVDEEDEDVEVTLLGLPLPVGWEMEIVELERKKESLEDFAL